MAQPENPISRQADLTPAKPDATQQPASADARVAGARVDVTTSSGVDIPTPPPVNLAVPTPTDSAPSHRVVAAAEPPRRDDQISAPVTPTTPPESTNAEPDAAVPALLRPRIPGDDVPTDAKTGVHTPDPEVAFRAKAILDPKTKKDDHPLLGTPFASVDVVRGPDQAAENTTYEPVSPNDLPTLRHLLARLENGGLDVSRVSLEDFAIQRIGVEQHLRLNPGGISEADQSYTKIYAQSDLETVPSPRAERSEKSSPRADARSAEPRRTGRRTKDDATLELFEALRTRGTEEYPQIQAGYIEKYLQKPGKNPEDPNDQRKALQAFQRLASFARELYGKTAVPDQRGTKTRPPTPETLETLADLTDIESYPDDRERYLAARETYIARGLSINPDADTERLTRNFASLANSLRERFSEAAIPSGRAKATLPSQRTDSPALAEPEETILDEPTDQPRLNGKRLEISGLANAITAAGGDLTTYLTPRQLEILEAVRDTSLEDNTAVAERLEMDLPKRVLHAMKQIATKLEHEIPARARATRVTFSDGTRIPLLALTSEGINQTLLNLRREVRDAYPANTFDGLQLLAGRIETVAKEVLDKATEKLGGTPVEDRGARLNVVTLYAGTIAKAIDGFTTFSPERKDEFTEVAIEVVQAQVPEILQSVNTQLASLRARQTGSSPMRNPTSEVISYTVRKTISKHIAATRTDTDEE